jgi:hypothetical protein
MSGESAMLSHETAAEVHGLADSAAMVAASLRRQGWRGQAHACGKPGCQAGGQ